MFNELNILEPFFGEPNTWYHLRQLSRILDLSPVTVKSKLEEFVSSGVLDFKEERGFHLYRANVDSEDFRWLLIIRNLKLVRDSGLIDFLNKELVFSCLILFGSWAKGENVPRSDLDLFVLSEEKKKVNLSGFEKELGCEIHLFLYNMKGFEELKRKSPRLVNNVLNGRILSGYLKVFS